MGQGPDSGPLLPTPDFHGQSPLGVARIWDDLSVVVRDGDAERAVRLIGVRIDADEDRTRIRPVLEGLLLGESVFLVAGAQPGPDGAEAPQPAYVFRAPDGLFVNLELIRQGAARVQTRPVFEHRELFRHYEGRARAAQKGLWSPRPAAVAAPGASSNVPATEQAAGGGEDTVYVTRTGTKYHRAGCQHLSKSSSPIKLADARRGYQPCKVCRPPE